MAAFWPVSFLLQPRQGVWSFKNIIVQYNIDPPGLVLSTGFAWNKDTSFNQEHSFKQDTFFKLIKTPPLIRNT